MLSYGCQLVLYWHCYHGLLCYAIPCQVFSQKKREIGTGGEKKVAIHEWHLYMQAVEHSPNIRLLRIDEICNL